MSNDETFVILTPGFPKDEADSTCIPTVTEVQKAKQLNIPILKRLINGLVFLLQTLMEGTKEV